jgi:hypothetical protein
MFARDEVQDIYSLSPMQQGMLFHYLEAREAGVHIYVEQTCITVRGEIDVALFEQSFNRIVGRYDVLRTVFVYKTVEIPRQVVLKERRARVYYEDISHLREAERARRLEGFRARDRRRGFHLGRDMLMRAAVIKTGAAAYTIIWSAHHIIIDGWCMGIIFKDLLRVYQSLKQGTPPELEPVVPYGRYIHWLDRQEKERALWYWQAYLAGYRQAACLPRLAGTGEKQKQPGGEFREGYLTLEEGLSAGLRRLARQTGVTMNVVMQTVWGILLQRYNACRDVVFGAVVSGRPPQVEGIENMVGLFINTVPVRIQLPEERETVAGLLKRVQTDMLARRPYEYLPLAEIQARSRLKEQPIDHLFIFENYPVQRELEAVQQSTPRRSIGFTVETMETFADSSYDFNVIVGELESVTIKFCYNAAVYTADIETRLARHLKEIVRQAACPDRPVKDVSIVPAAEKSRILSTLKRDRQALRLNFDI